MVLLINIYLMPPINPKPIIIAGPTASGKTDLALALAKKTDGIIISADSRQVYKTLPIGTAAPAGKWEDSLFISGGIPYYLVDILDINERFDVSKFIAASVDIISKNKGRQIIFAGGTGMYLQGFFCGMDALPKADEELRKSLAGITATHGKEYLHNLLKEADPASAAKIPAGNLHRVIRALEIHRLTGRPASELRTGGFSNDKITSEAKFIYLNWDKESLNKRIEKRTSLIFDGMCEEAASAIKKGYAKDCPGLKSLGYSQAIEYLEGQVSKEAAVERITILTRQYAKRQRTWFGRYKKAAVIDIKESPSFNVEELSETILKL